MKAVLSLLIAVFLSVSSSAQTEKPTLFQLKRVMLTGSFDKADSILKRFDYKFQKTEKNNSGGKCYDLFIWKRFNAGKDYNPDYYEVVVLFKKCEGAIWYNYVRYLTYDENSFNKLKTECQQQEGISGPTESTEDGCVIRYFKGSNFNYYFKNCYGNTNEYHLDIRYDFPF